MSSEAPSTPQWWLDPTSGQVEMTGQDVDDSLPEDELEEHGAVPIPPVDSHRSYRDMKDFIATLDDEQVRFGKVRDEQTQTEVCGRRHCRPAGINLWSDI